MHKDLVTGKTWYQELVDKTIMEQVTLREHERLRTQEGIEERIYIRLQQIWKDVKIYCPDIKHLSLCVIESDGSTSFSATNEYYAHDKEFPIHLFVDIEHEGKTDGTDKCML